MGFLCAVDLGGASPRCISNCDEADAFFPDATATADYGTRSIPRRSVGSGCLVVNTSCLAGFEVLICPIGLLSLIYRGGASLRCFSDFDEAAAAFLNAAAAVNINSACQIDRAS